MYIYSTYFILFIYKYVVLHNTYFILYLLIWDTFYVIELILLASIKGIIFAAPQRKTQCFVNRFYVVLFDFGWSTKRVLTENVGQTI